MRFAWFIISIGVCIPECLIAGEVSSEQSSVDVSQEAPKKSINWQVMETSSFVIHCFASESEARRLGGHCESLRQTLQAKWLGNQGRTQWNPRCDVVIHATRDNYLQAVGPEGAQTRGASYIEVRGGQVVARRLDLLPEPDGSEPTALPHELTHVVLADRFCRGRIPPWADEGMAVLADSPEKRRLHHRDLLSAVEAGSTIGLGDLLGSKTCPCGSSCATFYGQSAALVECLTTRDRPQRFVEFVEQAMSIGNDAALKQIYGIEGTGELARVFRNHLASRQQGGQMVAREDTAPGMRVKLVPVGLVPTRQALAP